MKSYQITLNHQSCWSNHHFYWFNDHLSICFLLKVSLNYLNSHLFWARIIVPSLVFGFFHLARFDRRRAAASLTLAEAVLRVVTGFASRADFTEERPLGGLGFHTQMFGAGIFTLPTKLGHF